MMSLRREYFSDGIDLLARLQSHSSARPEIDLGQRGRQEQDGGFSPVGHRARPTPPIRPLSNRAATRSAFVTVPMANTMRGLIVVRAPTV